MTDYENGSLGEILTLTLSEKAAIRIFTCVCADINAKHPEWHGGGVLIKTRDKESNIELMVDFNKFNFTISCEGFCIRGENYINWDCLFDHDRCVTQFWNRCIFIDPELFSN